MRQQRKTTKTTAEVLLGWWDTHPTTQTRSVYNVIARYAKHYDVSKERFSKLMSILGKSLAERKAWKPDRTQMKLFK